MVGVPCRLYDLFRRHRRIQFVVFVGCVNSRAHIKYALMIHLKYWWHVCLWKRRCERALWCGPFTRRTKYVQRIRVCNIYSNVLGPARMTPYALIVCIKIKVYNYFSLLCKICILFKKYSHEF